ncbi:transglutaminase domain-containing protein [Treponema sp. HNW]|uniref:transglutaminase domain-containing protein n=1 Tax=Treponema sp. HNW TaxID=3116654 RepID=UPI003D1359C5
MSILGHCIYRFRKHPLFRAVFILGLTALIVFLFFYLSAVKERPPVLTGIHPAVGEPGDVITITGKNFGDSKATDSFVEIAGGKLSSSAYISWTDTLIRAVLPYNVEDGLVYVQTKNGKSEAEIFANRQTLPVPIRHNPKTALPFIASIDKKTMHVGALITLRGGNFGNLRGSSRVFFTAGSAEGTKEKALIPCSDFDADYHFWSDTELQVRIPDGADSGYVYVETDYGKSNGFDYSLASPPVTKTYTDLRTYSVKLSADISDAQAEANATLTLFIPLPRLTSTQRNVQIVASNPEPSISGYLNTLVHRINLNEIAGKKSTFSHTFAVGIHGLHTQVDETKIKAYSEDTKKIYAAYLKNGPLIPSDNQSLRSLAASIVKKEKNPYRKAKLLYEWMLENIFVESRVSASERDIADILRLKKADAYEAAVLYTALLRAEEIPALTNAGILVDADMQSRNHWWCEFYIEGAGWIPVDPALGAGLEYKSFQRQDSRAQFYFGSLDAQHITFSRGWNNIKPAHIAGKKVYRPKSYALQSIWEETTAGTVKYSSYWQDAAVTGVY